MLICSSEQRNSKLILKQLHLTTYGRMGHMKLFTRLREALRLGYHLEHLQLSKIHRVPRVQKYGADNAPFRVAILVIGTISTDNPNTNILSVFPSGSGNL